MIVWPFIVMTLAFTVGLGYAISKIEREQVMKHWADRRCQVPIMVSAPFFKPTDDPRTGTQFAKDNFSFCMDQLVKEITSDILKPLLDVFGKHGYIAKILTDVLNDIRTIIKIVYQQFLEFMDGFLRKYQNIASQVRNVTLRLKQVFERTNAIMLSVVFMGLSLIRGLMNSVDFVIKVVMIIMGIMIAIIIILFFILFPFMPLILSVIAAIMAVAVGSVAGQAASYRSGFCFAPETLIVLNNGRTKCIRDIEIGDVLYGGSVVESYMKMSGKNVPLWSISNIYVSETHLVESQYIPDTWHPVSHDVRAKRTHYMDGYLYCLNTSNHIIPVQGVAHNIIRFRDWEELRENDLEGHRIWNLRVMEELNKGIDPTVWNKYVNSSTSYSVLSPNTRVKTLQGSKLICELKIGDLILDENNQETEILGTVQSMTEISKGSSEYWSSNVLYKNPNDTFWKRTEDFGNDLNAKIGCHLITQQGTFQVIDSEKPDNTIIYRDFTEVGHTLIEFINICVESRLRTPARS